MALRLLDGEDLASPICQYESEEIVRGAESRLTTKFSGGTPAHQHAGAVRLGSAGRGSPAAEHFMRPRPLQRRVRRLGEDSWRTLLEAFHSTPSHFLDLPHRLRTLE
jgi:hypothetical protein